MSINCKSSESEIASRVAKDVVSAFKIRYKYKVVTGNGIFTYNSKEELIRKMRGAGMRYMGDNQNHRQRDELQGQPWFNSLVGPMWDGNNSIRYETQDIYSTLSR